MDPVELHPWSRQLEAFSDADAAVARIQALYDRSVAGIRNAFQALQAGAGSVPDFEDTYPYLGIAVGFGDLHIDAVLSYGMVQEAGVYGTTLTRPDLFGGFYRSQIAHLIDHHKVPVVVGASRRRIPLPFAVEDATAGLTEDRLHEIQSFFALPDLAATDDAIANGTDHSTEPRPLALFPAERVDYSLHRLGHYTATSPAFFQRFVLLTNYQRYVDEFRLYAQRTLDESDEYQAFVEPGDQMTVNRRCSLHPPAPRTLSYPPQMPAYHLVRPDRKGLTLVDIGVGPSNAKTITDHLAVLRPECWVMVGHCAGLRRSQFLGDYVLAHGYVRGDHVLDRDLPAFVPVPPIAEVQVALQRAVAKVTGLDGRDLKTRMRTGTVFTTDNRNWELRYAELYEQLNQSRAIAVDMESGTIAANGFRFRVPYGTLLCVSDKPLHGEIKLRGMTNALYRERVSQHLQIGIEALRMLRDDEAQLHSRKLRSFDEPGFR